MSFKEKMRLNLPLYVVLSVIFSVAVWSLWLPNWFGKVDSAEASPVTSFSTPVTVVNKLPSGAQNKLIFVNGTYALVYASSTTASSPTTTCNYATTGASANSACRLYFTTSTNGGVTWSTPVVISTSLFFGANREAIADFAYDYRRNAYVVLYKELSSTDLIQAYSTDGTNWSTATVISDNAVSGNYVGRNASMFFSTTSDFRVVLAQRGPYMVIATTSNTGLVTAWPTSTVDRLIGYFDSNSNGWENARPLGVSVDNNNVIHALYEVASSTALTYNIIYASSSDLGLTWATTSISGTMSLMSSNFVCFECGLNTTAVDPYTGYLSVMYYQATSVNGGLIASSILNATSSLKIGRQGSNGQWTTSTLDTNLPLNYSFASTLLIAPQPAGLSVPYTGMYAGGFFATSSNPYVFINTSTNVMERINTETLFNMSEISTAYNTTSKEFAVAYVDGSNYRLRFTTTSLPITALNGYASTTAITPSFPSDATGRVLVNTTVSDPNRETVTVYVDYSADGGLTWASSTLYSATGQNGSLTTSTGKITGVATTNGTLTTVSQNISFYWNSLADLPASSTTGILLRIKASDGISDSPNYTISAPFTVDNLAPDVPTALTLTPSTSSIAFSWTSAGASFYSVSSSAMSASTTVQTTVTSTSLNPNTLYYFQVKAQDSYSNTSSFSAVTSTYTNPVAPTSAAAVSTGQTTMTVTWSSVNPAGTVYELFNVTTNAVVDTTTDTSYNVTGLTAGTSYQFKVRAQYLAASALYTEYSDPSSAVSTDAASSGGGGGGGGGTTDTNSGGSAPVYVPPSIPATVQPVTPAGTIAIELGINQPMVRVVGPVTHTFTALSADTQKLTLKIQSEPITVNLLWGEVKQVDTDNDGVADLRVTYSGLVQGKAKVVTSNLTDTNELKNALTIQAGAYETSKRMVVLNFNTNATQVALSNSADFTGATFRSLSPKMTWELSTGIGTKTVYARLRSAQGSTVTVSDTIILTDYRAEEIKQTPPTTPTKPTTTFPELKRVMKRGMTGADVKQAQLYLQTTGYFPKNIVANGVFGPTTEVAVKALQKFQGLPQNGEISAGLWSVMTGESSLAIPSLPEDVPEVTKPNLVRGSKGEQVLWVQKKLLELGYFPKSVMPNSYYGPTTQNSVRAFQKAKGISQTGTVGPLTWSALSK